MLLVNLLVLGVFGIGFVVGWRTIRRVRAPFVLEDALYSWRETPASVFHYDKLTGILILVHALATITLCSLLVRSVNQASVSPISMTFNSPASGWLATILGYEDTQVWLLSAAIAALSAGIAAFNCGAIVSFPFARYFIRPVLVHLHLEGIVYGQNSVHWQDIIFYQVDRKRNLLKIFTNSHPQSPSFVLHPPSDALFIETENKVRGLLSSNRADATSFKLKRRWLLCFTFLLITLILLLGAFWIDRYTAEWVWVLYSAGIVGLVAVGDFLEKI